MTGSRISERIHAVPTATVTTSPRLKIPECFEINKLPKPIMVVQDVRVIACAVLPEISLFTESGNSL